MRSQAMDSFKLLVAVITGLVLLLVAISLMQAPRGKETMVPSERYISEAFR
jgi:hypothetical protein